MGLCLEAMFNLLRATLEHLKMFPASVLGAPGERTEEQQLPRRDLKTPDQQRTSFLF